MQIKADFVLKKFKEKCQEYRCAQGDVFFAIYFYHFLAFLDRVFTVPEVKNDFLS